MIDERLFRFQSRDEAIRFQIEMSKLVIEKTPPYLGSNALCGLDMAYRQEEGFASAVLWDLNNANVIAKAESRGPVQIGYIPGLLGFREGPLLVSAARKLDTRPDIFLVDGHGRAHPRRFGLACHVGLALDRPTIGIGKSHFYGIIEGENIVGPNGPVGKIVKASNGKKYYVSVGHRIQLDDAARLVRNCLVNNQPAPLREAHIEAGRTRRQG